MPILKVFDDAAAKGGWVYRRCSGLKIVLPCQYHRCNPLHSIFNLWALIATTQGRGTRGPQFVSAVISPNRNFSEIRGREVERGNLECVSNGKRFDLIDT
ncbi:hypothetical protein EVAR_4103_1 [Eumeta japonica]|uniref:Uncharacterized protein n=1 Tax=Eumeta variegata TaxID=151549 RepID=A0A4C1T6S3_EUMVA|nr:hypothetical protein EVAR_4103_1 [Eumeta japonica]